MIEISILMAIAARLDAALNGHHRPPHAIKVDDVPYGWVDTKRAARLAAFPYVFARDGEDLVVTSALDTPTARSEALAVIATTLAAEGALTAWRNESYAVRKSFAEAPVFQLERAAARYFGIHTYAAHANGIVDAARDVGAPGATASGPRMWLARRSPTKAIDPSLLDNLVGGGIAGDESSAEALRREAWEEAGIADSHVGEPVATVTVERAVPEGYQHETIFAYDLLLPATFVPRNQDGEAVEHRCVEFNDAARLMANVRGPDVVTIDATLVALDCLRRYRAIAS